jgi:hypothetical protein
MRVANCVIIVRIPYCRIQLNAMLLMCVRFDSTIVIKNGVYLFVLFITNTNNNSNINKLKGLSMYDIFIVY